MILNAHAQDRRLPILQNGTAHYRSVEAVLWLRKDFGSSGDWTVNDQNDLLARLFGFQKVNKA